MDSARSAADRVLDAALALVTEEGPGALSIREVARRVGLTPMAIYRHFDGLDALRAALRARAATGLMAALTEGLAEPETRARLEASARSYVRWAIENPALFRLLFSGGPPPLAAAAAAEVRRDASAFRFLVDRMREGMDAGLLPAGDPEARAIDWWALFHGLVHLQLEGKLRLEPSRFMDHVDATLRWLLRPG